MLHTQFGKLTMGLNKLIDSSDVGNMFAKKSLHVYECQCVIFERQVITIKKSLIKL